MRIFQLLLNFFSRFLSNLDVRWNKKGIVVSACPAGHFLCNDHSKCISGDQFQNGIEDCKDGSDEGNEFYLLLY